MNCDRAKSLLNWFYDGELDAPDRKLVAEHLENCPSCAAELAGLAELDRTSRQLVAPEPPAALWGQIVSRLPAPAAGKAARTRMVGRRHFLLAGGALAASVLGGILIYRTGGQKKPDNAGGDVPVVEVPLDGAHQEDAVGRNLALLSPEDRRLVEVQRVCVAAGCGNPLGAAGEPVKAVLLNEPVFLCCEQCEQWAKAHPKEAVARVHELEAHHHDFEKRP
jgi:anti-sigma factor RsiW